MIPKTSPSHTKPDSGFSAWLHGYAKIVAAATLILILAGGLVTSTGSGLSVPDWPLSYGKFFPPMIGGIRFEHTHRVIAGFVGILTFILMLAFLKNEPRRWVRALSLSAFLLVVAQAVLGGITVIYLLPPAVSIAHACLAQTFFCLLVSLALFTSREWKEASATSLESAPSLHRLLTVTTTFVYLQLIAGAVVRHTGKGIGYHLIIAILIVFHTLLVLLRISREEETRKALVGHALFLGWAVTIQIFLGFGAFIMTIMLPKTEIPRLGEVIFTASHQTTAALILAVSLTLTLRSFRLFKKGAGQKEPVVEVLLNESLMKDLR